MNAYISKVFGKMFLGLVVTAIAALAVIMVPSLTKAILGTPLMFVFLIAEFVIVIALSSRLGKISYSSANIMFFLYAIVNGFTLSSIFLVYDLGTIYMAFFTAAISFGAMSVYGLVTKSDLTKFGNIFMMLLIGIIVASIINIFMRSSGLELLISFVAVAVFCGLVAFDTQKLKGYYYQSMNDYQMQRKISVIGALSLYLDFINIFLYLLRIFGSNRRD